MVAAKGRIIFCCHQSSSTQFFRVLELAHINGLSSHGLARATFEWTDGDSWWHLSKCRILPKRR